MARRTADDIANEALALIDLNLDETTEREDQLLAILLKVVNGATRTKGVDSTGREYAHINQNLLDLGRETLRKYGVKNVSCRTDIKGRYV